MAVKIGHARHDENNKIKNGAAGDQTGGEVAITNWYLHAKGWVVLRCKDAAKREKIAQAAEKACKNNQIGYDQYQRDTLFNNVKDKGFDPSKTTKKVECDCSALVRVCIAYAYGKDIAGNIRTVSEPAALVKTGEFDKYTSAKYCKSSDFLRRGDVLCTPVSGHTVVVLTDGAKVTKAATDGKLVTDGSFGTKTVKATQKVLGTTVDGVVSNQKATQKKYLEAAYGNAWEFKLINYSGGSAMAKAVQKLIGTDVTGFFDKKTVTAMQKFLQVKGYDCGEVDGYMGEKTVTAWQKYINSRL